MNYESTNDDTDDRYDEVVNRVPNSIEDDINEVDSFNSMWVNPKSNGGILLQFYPNMELIIRQLGHTQQSMIAILFYSSNVLDVHDRSEPTRLSTPLSVLEAVYPNGGYIGIYEKNKEPKESSELISNHFFLVPKVLLIVASPTSSKYIKNLCKWRGGVSYVVITGNKETIENIIRGKPNREYTFSIIRETSSFVNFIRGLNTQFVFPLILLATNTTSTDSTFLFDENTWALDNYGLYYHHD